MEQVRKTLRELCMKKVQMNMYYGSTYMIFMKLYHYREGKHLLLIGIIDRGEGGCL